MQRGVGARDPRCLVVDLVRDEAIPPAMARAVSTYIGMAREVRETTVEAGLPRLVNVGVSAARTGPSTGAEIGARAGSCHFSRVEAWCAAIGETIERFSATHVPPQEVRLGIASDIGPEAVSPDVLRLYRSDPPGRNGCCNPGWQTILGWSRGTRLSDGASRALPAQMVYLGYHLGAGEPRLGMFTSSGLSCERSLPAAVLGGLLEQIERDACMLAWRLRMSLPRFEWRRDPAFARVAELMRGVRPELTLLDGSVFMGVPVVISVLRDPNATYPVGVVVSASAGLTVTDAAESAFREAFQTLFIASLIARDQADADGAGEAFDEHVARFVPADGARRADFLTASTETVDADNIPSIAADEPLDALRLVAEQLAEQDVEAIAFDLTTADVACLDLHVARVFCPQLVWLDVDFDHPFDGRVRLDAVARQFGLPLDADGRAVLNPDPHPLP